MDSWDVEAMAASIEAMLDGSNSTDACDVEAMAGSIEAMLDGITSTDQWDVDTMVGYIEANIEAMLDSTISTDTDSENPQTAPSCSHGPAPRKNYYPPKDSPPDSRSAHSQQVMKQEKDLPRKDQQTPFLSSISRMRKKDAEKPYIKKPPNAFMLYKAEQREKIMFELNIRNSAHVNKIVGERWSMLSAEEQAPYFQQSWAAKREHYAKYPGWSTSENFGQKKRKMANTKTPTDYSPPAASVQTGLYNPFTMVLQDCYHTSLQITGAT